jgi:hypothetical protein
MCITAIGADDVSPPNSASDENLQLSAQIDLLQKTIRSLQKQLDESSARCHQLELSNAELQAKLRVAATQPASIQIAQSDEDPLLIVLPQPHWNSNGTAEPQVLGSCPTATGIKIEAVDQTITARPSDPCHLSLILRRMKGGLGDISEEAAGKIWIQGRVLMLQWTDKDNSAQAIEKLKFSAVRAVDSGGNIVQSFGFFSPASVSLPLDRDGSAKIEVPSSIGADCKLCIATPPDGWDLFTPDKSTLILRHSPAIARLEYDSRSAKVSISPEDIETVDPAHHLAALRTQLATAERQLADTTERYNAAPVQGTTVDGGSFGTRYYASPREGLAQDIQAENERIAKLNEWIKKAEDESSSSGPAMLDGSVVNLVLPNGIVVAKVTLISDQPK